MLPLLHPRHHVLEKHAPSALVLPSLPPGGEHIVCRRRGATGGGRHTFEAACRDSIPMQRVGVHRHARHLYCHCASTRASSGCHHRQFTHANRLAPTREKHSREERNERETEYCRDDPDERDANDRENLGRRVANLRESLTRAPAHKCCLRRGRSSGRLRR